MSLVTESPKATRREVCFILDGRSGSSFWARGCGLQMVKGVPHEEAPGKEGHWPAMRDILALAIGSRQPKGS